MVFITPIPHVDRAVQQFDRVRLSVEAVPGDVPHDTVELSDSAMALSRALAIPDNREVLIDIAASSDPAPKPQEAAGGQRVKALAVPAIGNEEK